MEFVALFGCGALRGDHDAGVVDKDIETGVFAEEGLGGGFDGGEVVEVEVEVYQSPVGFGCTGFDLGDGFLGFALGTSGDVDFGVV